MITSPIGQVNASQNKQRFGSNQYSPQVSQGFGGVQRTPPNLQNLGMKNSPQIRPPYQHGPYPNQSGIGPFPNQSGIQPFQQFPMQSVTIPAPPVYQQVERIEQPLQVVDLYQVEEPWRQKAAQLEKQIEDAKNAPPQQVQSDDSRVNEIEKELSQAYAQIQQLINSLKILQEENQGYGRSNDEKRRRIDQLEQQLRAKEDEINDVQGQIDDLNAQLDEISTETEEKNAHLVSDVSKWKQKFIDLNKEYHQSQEELMLAQAELDNLKHSTTQTTKVTTSTTRTTRQ